MVIAGSAAFKCGVFTEFSFAPSGVSPSINANTRACAVVCILWLLCGCENVFHSGAGHTPRRALLPNQLQSKLNLAGGCGSAGDGSCSAGGFCAGTGRREGDQIWRVEVGAVQQIENFCAELQSQALVQRRCFKRGEVPG